MDEDRDDFDTNLDDEDENPDDEDGREEQDDNIDQNPDIQADTDKSHVNFQDIDDCSSSSEGDSSSGPSDDGKDPVNIPPRCPAIVREKFHYIALVILSLPIPFVTLLLGVIRYGKDAWWEKVVQGKKALPPNFPCHYFRGRTFNLVKDEFPQEELYLALLPDVGTDVYIIFCSALYILVSVGMLFFLCFTVVHMKIVRSWVLLWAIAGSLLAFSLMVATAATATQTTINNQASYQKAVQSIQIFEAEMYGVVVTSGFGGKERPVEMSVNNLQKGVSAFQAFRLREQCQALLTVFQYCASKEVDEEVKSPTFVVRQETCKASDMTEAGFCPTKSYFIIFVLLLVWTVLHAIYMCIVVYFMCDGERRLRDTARNLPIFHEAQEAQGMDTHSHSHQKDTQPYYAPSHPDQYERLKKYNEIFLRDFNKP